MKRIKLAMVRDDLELIPEAPLPEGYRFKLYEAGDESAWTDIEVLASEFPTSETALERFKLAFGASRDELPKRCLFLVNPDGRLIGTTTAWWGDTLGETRGRIHFVGIVPDEQGKQLAKPLLAEAMRLLVRNGHESAYLTTQTTSWRAVNLYLRYGFRPHRHSDTCEEGWAMIERQLGRNV